MEEDQLLDTVRYVGCYATIDDMIGISFKGLLRPIDITINGKPYRCEPGTFQPLALKPAVKERIEALIYLWRCLQHLIDLEVNPNSDPVDLSLAREHLNETYDEFVDEYGYIKDNKNLLFFDKIPDPRLSSLPELEVGRELKKAPIFSDRILQPNQIISGQMFFDEELDTRLQQALHKCLSESNQINMARIAELAGVDEETAERILIESQIIYREPVVPADGEFSRSAGTRI